MGREQVDGGAGRQGAGRQGAGRQGTGRQRWAEGQVGTEELC